MMNDPLRKIPLQDCKSSCLLYIQNKNTLILGTNSNKILKFDSPFENISHTQIIKVSQIDSLSEGAEGKFWASGLEDSTSTPIIILLSLELKSLKVFTSHTDNIISLVFNKSFLYSASEDCSVRVWSENSPDSSTIYTHESPIISFDLHKKEEIIASCDSNNTLIIFSITENKQLWTKQLEEKVWAMKFHIGKNLICGDHSGNLIGFNYKTQDFLFRFVVHESRIKSIWVLEEFIVTGSFDQTVCVWNALSQIVVEKFENHCDWVRGVTAGGGFVFSVADDDTLCICTFKAKKEGERRVSGGQSSLNLPRNYKFVIGSGAILIILGLIGIMVYFLVK